MPSIASTHRNINTASCPNTTTMIKTDPVWGVGKQVVVPFLMGHLGLGKMEMARGLSRLRSPNSPCDGVGTGGGGHTNLVRERQRAWQ